MRITTLFLISLVLLWSGCQSDSTPETTTPPPVQSKAVKVPKFDRDSAYAFVEKQVNFGPRVPNTPAHTACKDWMVNTFKSMGADVIEQNFTAKAYNGVSLNGTNIIARYNPKHSKRILIAAHWDSRPTADHDPDESKRKEPVLGADDGGSGVGVILELARVINENAVDIGVDFILFDLEDYGEDGTNNVNSWGLGSQHWSRNIHVGGYRPKYALLLDMVGAKNARFAKEQFSMQAAGPFVNKLWKLANNMGYGNYFVNETTGPVTDDHYFVNTIARIPMIDIINKPVESETGFGHYWHTVKDDMSVIDKRTLRAVGQLLLAFIYQESGGNFK